MLAAAAVFLLLNWYFTAELVLHRAAAHVHDRRAAQPARAGAVRHGRGRGEQRDAPSGPARGRRDSQLGETESLLGLARLVGNLLDMSRLQAGALSLFPRPAGVDEIVARSLDDLGPRSREVIVDIPEALPAVKVDPDILERVIVNLTENALRYSPPGRPPMLTASALGDHVELRVVDRGPGITEKERDRMFVPFQRLGDTDNTTGVGLGLARGFTEAMGGTLTAEDTPGGGLTMAIIMSAAPAPEPPDIEPGRRERAVQGQPARAGLDKPAAT